MMKNLGILLIVLILMGAIAYLSPRVITTAALMVAGVIVAALVRSATRKNPEQFRWPAVFHKCCATIHWAFISFYLFSFDRLRADLPLRPIDWIVLILLGSFCRLHHRQH